MSERLRNLQALFRTTLSDRTREACWQPSVDVYRAERAWLVKFDLAGVCPEDLEVALDHQRLTVRGYRRDWVILDGQQAYSMEIAYNRFERVVELPVDLESAQIVSEYRDGMFLVRIVPSE